MGGKFQSIKFVPISENAQDKTKNTKDNLRYDHPSLGLNK